MTAVIVGGTGLVGGHVLEVLRADPRWEPIIAWCRKAPADASARIHWQVVDFDAALERQLADQTLMPQGADVFCCLGTTIKKAGSQEAFARVDHTYVVELARLASRQNARSFQIVSSLGANPDSGNFYLRTKGQAEEEIRALPLSSVSVLRPSLLLGDRDESRVGEAAAQKTSWLWGSLLHGPLRKYRAIHGRQVAAAMVARAQRAQPGFTVLESDQLVPLAAQGLRAPL